MTDFYQKLQFWCKLPNIGIAFKIKQKFQLAQKLHEEHENPSIVFLDDGNEEHGLHGEERDAFERLLSLTNKTVLDVFAGFCNFSF